jgi:hypothetical protein
VSSPMMPLPNPRNVASLAAQLAKQALLVA